MKEMGVEGIAKYIKVQRLQWLRTIFRSKKIAAIKLTTEWKMEARRREAKRETKIEMVG